MKNKILKYIKEILVFIITMTIFANGVSLYRSMELNKAPLPSSLHAESNKPIMIHFWATWWPVCKVEIDNIQKISTDYQVITIAVKSGSDEDIQNYLDERDLDFKVINDTDGFLAQQFGVSIYPTTFIYDEDKNMIFSDVGYTSTWGLWLRMLYAK